MPLIGTNFLLRGTLKKRLKFNLMYLLIIAINAATFVQADDLKAEWKKLQDSYRQAMLRRRTKSGQAAKKMKVWKYELQMSFLLADTIPRG